MKKSLFLLPVAAMLITGCKGKDKDENKVPEETFIAIEDENVLSEAIAQGVEETYKKAVKNFSVTNTVSGAHFKMDQTITTTDPGFTAEDTHIEVSNLSYTVTFQIQNLTSAVEDWVGYLGIKDLGFTMNSNGSTFNVSKAKLEVYLKDNMLYIDLSDSHLKSAVIAAVTAITGSSNPGIELAINSMLKEYKVVFTDAIEFVWNIVSSYANKLYILETYPAPVISPSKELISKKDKLGIPEELPADAIAAIKEVIPGLISSLGEEAPFVKDALKFMISSKGYYLASLELNLENLKDVSDLSEMFSKFDIATNVIIAADKTLQSIKLDVELKGLGVDNLPAGEGYKTTETTAFELSMHPVSTFSYSESEIVVPDFPDAELIPIEVSEE